MLKDGKEVELTREEALRLHRMMWMDMQKELGDCPNTVGRLVFKREWAKKHGYTDVLYSCFLCEYVRNIKDRGRHGCSSCPIDWSSLSASRPSWCTSEYRLVRSCCNNSIHGNALISEILALPEREVE